MADAAGIMEARDGRELKPGFIAGPHKDIRGNHHLDWGMRNRLSRLIGADGRTQFLPIDHGYFQGPTRCLECPGQTIEELLPYADALFVTRGVLRSCVSPDVDVPIILRVSGGVSVVGHDLAAEVLTTSIEEIIRQTILGCLKLVLRHFAWNSDKNFCCLFVRKMILGSWKLSSLPAPGLAQSMSHHGLISFSFEKTVS